jgi:thymidylate synthase (FAD)
MAVKVVWVTPGAMETVAYCARVSNPTNQHNMSTAPQLIKYLIRNKHFSPFEMANACLEIVTTRDIARQILRHRSFTFQEFSQRYAAVTDEFVLREARLQDTKNRQNSLPIDGMTGLVTEWEERQKEVSDVAREMYEWALNNGIAKEQARAVLPEGMTLSRIYMNGTLRSWMHYIDTRTGNGTQREHMKIAQECKRALEEKGIDLWT